MSVNKVYDYSSSEEDELVLFALLLRRRRQRQNKKKCSKRRAWVKKWIERRPAQGAFCNLLKELEVDDPEKFKQFHRMDSSTFNHILSLVGPLITKKDTVMRDAISTEDRLAVTLRFLATGETFRSLSFLFRMGERTISCIVDETCQAIYTSLKDKYLKAPSSPDTWQKIAQDFEEKWNYPACLGAIDGKHVRIQQPNNSGSQFFNYKHFFSVLLLAVADANYKFIYVDVGAAGRSGDAGVYADSALKGALAKNAMSIPPPKTILDGNESKVSYHFIGDDAFPMTDNLMKPYPHRNLSREKRIFNYRLSRARRVVENAFGIFSNRFRVFHSVVNQSPDKVTHLILAACCLHNVLIDTTRQSYLGSCDVEDTSNYNITPGAWRDDFAMTGLESSINRNPSRAAKETRNILCEYFNSTEGAVPWQDNMISGY